MAREQEIRDLNAYHLADMADCAAPDSDESAGASFLLSVRDEFLEKADYGLGNHPEDTMTEIANEAPDVYTGRRWAEFLDLAAYNEEPELGDWPANLTDAAGVALYQIAERLLRALLDMWQTGDDAEED